MAMNKKAMLTELQGIIELLLNHSLSPADQERLQFLLNSHPAARSYYLDYMDLHVQLKLGDKKELEARPVISDRDLRSWGAADHRRKLSRRILLSTASATAAIVFAAAMLLLWTRPSDNTTAANATQLVHSLTETAAPPLQNSPPSASQPAPPAVILEEEAGARFYHSSPLRPGDPLTLNQQYTLVEGHIELRFSCGAQAILDAPAVFEPRSGEQLFVSFGTCSIDANNGSERFQLVTPSSLFAQRDTRYLVTVNELGGSEVHVIEGRISAIEPGITGKRETQISSGQARKYQGGGDPLPAAIAYSADRYRNRLPDRLVAFDGERNELGEIATLETVSVIRRGQLIHYSFNELIGGDVVSFCERGAAKTTNFILPLDFNGERADLCLHDNSFLTGILNPGGAVHPYLDEIQTPETTTKSSEWTPGMTIRFRKPVINSPGPDILIFDAQTAVHPLEGDFYHVRPLILKPGYSATSIRQLDIDMLSPASIPMQKFILLETSTVISSLDELMRAPLRPSNISINYRVTASSVDLSDMGLAEGESLTEIFLQDAMDNEHRIDPVMIVGLPELIDEEKVSSRRQSH
jgi:hypothetical protein